MLQGRLFSYGDAQRYRLGVNHNHILVNAAKCPVNSYHRDGQMRVDGNQGATISYEPNNQGKWAEQPDYSQPPLDLQGYADHWEHRTDDDYFSQAGNLFRLMTAQQQQALFANTAASMEGVSDEIKLRHIKHCTAADANYGAGLKAALKL